SSHARLGSAMKPFRATTEQTFWMVGSGICLPRCRCPRKTEQTEQTEQSPNSRGKTFVPTLALQLGTFRLPKVKTEHGFTREKRQMFRVFRVHQSEGQS